MAHILNINEILIQVKQLGKEEQLNLLNKLTQLIYKKHNNKKPLKLSSISGIGADIWGKTDIDKYLASEREW